MVRQSAKVSSPALSTSSGGYFELVTDGRASIDMQSAAVPATKLADAPSKPTEQWKATRREFKSVQKAQLGNRLKESAGEEYTVNVPSTKSRTEKYSVNVPSAKPRYEATENYTVNVPASDAMVFSEDAESQWDKDNQTWGSAADVETSYGYPIQLNDEETISQSQNGSDLGGRYAGDGFGNGEKGENQQGQEEDFQDAGGDGEQGQSQQGGGYAGAEFEKASKDGGYGGGYGGMMGSAMGGFGSGGYGGGGGYGGNGDSQANGKDWASENKDSESGVGEIQDLASEGLSPAGSNNMDFVELYSKQPATVPDTEWFVRNAQQGPPSDLTIIDNSESMPVPPGIAEGRGIGNRPDTKTNNSFYDSNGNGTNVGKGTLVLSDGQRSSPHSFFLSNTTDDVTFGNLGDAVTFEAKPSVDPAKAVEDIRIRGQRELRSPCLLYTSPSPRDLSTSRMPSSA